MAAVLGGALSIIASLDYLNGLLQWGLQTKWHFQYVGGWGFRFLHHLDFLLIALLLWLPSKPKPRIANALLVVGISLFILAAVIETIVSKYYP